jgi:hypothetical protein
MKRLIAIAALAALAVPSAALAANDNAALQTGKYQFFGTADKGKDPTGVKPTNHTIVMNESAPTDFGIAERFLNVKVDTLDDHIALDYYFVDRTCAGGSPRIQLSVDTDGDGDHDGNMFGYLGDKAFGGGCPSNVWVHEDMTNSAPKWDLTQLGGGMSMTWDAAEAHVSTTYPLHNVRTGAVVDDSQSFAPTATGVVHFDNLEIGNRTYRDPSDMIG